jgi:hypothetical protein
MEMTMKNKINLGILAMLTLLTMAFAGCSFSVGTNTTSSSANTAKPANSAPANTTASNTATAPKKDDKTKGEKLVNEKKPEGKSNKAKDVPIPADWIYMYDEAKGYGFYLPAGSTGSSDSVDGVDYFVATTPAPAEVAIIVFAFKDAKLTKEDLLDRAEKALAAMGETIQTGKLTGESDDYSVAEATMTSKDGTKSKAKILVGTDVSDNYVMIVGTDEAKFAANEKIIDEIWGSFEMWSGGASGDN